MSNSDIPDPKSQSNQPAPNPLGRSAAGEWWHRSFAPFRKAVVRGLGIVMPPLLTLVLFLWAWNIIDSYVLQPTEAVVRHLIVWSIADIRDDRAIGEEIETARRVGIDFEAREQGLRDTPPAWRADDGTTLVKVGQQWIPRPVFDYVSANPWDEPPQTAKAWYHQYVRMQYLPRNLVIPAFLSVFVLSLYLLGRVFAFGVGRILWTWLESIIHRLPVISNVYGAVKQVTDFAFSESELEFTRIVAVEYPRRGLWTIGFVTGESFLDVKRAAGEACLTVLMPTSPMPATGFVISVPKREVVDLNITVDQAIQFCVSCGVVVPPHQQSKTVPVLADAVAKRMGTPEPDSDGGTTAAEPAEPDNQANRPAQPGSGDGEQEDASPSRKSFENPENP